jgi:hypothetical protein
MDNQPRTLEKLIEDINISRRLDLITDKLTEIETTFILDLVDCPWCGGITRPVFVHDRGCQQCGRCKRDITQRQASSAKSGELL